MGMFDQEIPGYVSGPQRIRRAGSALGDQLAPGVERMTGYKSPKRKAMAIAESADLSSMSSIEDTYKQIQKINPTAATAWLKDAMSTFNAGTQRMSAQASYATARNKSPAKRETKFNQVTGQLQYVDNGAVVPGFNQMKPKPTPDTSDLGQRTALTKEDVEGLLDDAFDFGMLDFSGKKTSIDKDTLSSFVFSYSQINNIGPEEVIQGIVEGTIDVKKGSKQGLTPGATAPQTVNPFSVPAIPK